MKISKSKIDRLGERLKGNQATEDDLRLLDEFRRSFSSAYESLIATITDQLKLQPTGRPAKSTMSISEKLRRESIRLTQIQDIAGCRVIVSDVPEQNRVVSDLLHVFASARVIDRRASPSHGYRAVHVVVDLDGRLIEIQVRTSLQHLWAEVSEKLSDIIDPEIKYGGGDEDAQSALIKISNTIAKVEGLEPRLVALQSKLVALQSKSELTPPEILNDIREVGKNLLEVRKNLLRMLEKLLKVAQVAEGKDDISD